MYQLSRYRNYLSPLDYVTDRFDNVILALAISLILCAQSTIYVLANMRTLKDVLPVVSDNQLNINVTVWLLGLAIWVCEIAGGLEAVSITDSIQSVIMIISLIALPCVLHYHLGGAANSVELGCRNYATLDCTTPEFKLQYPGAACSSAGTASAYENGCLAYTRNIWTLYPAVDEGRFMEPLWGPVNTSDPAQESTWAGKLAYDGSKYYSFVPWQQLSFGVGFFAFANQPHWIQRQFAAKSANALKKGQFLMMFSGMVATLPGLLVGIQVAASLKAYYPNSYTPFGVVLAYLMDKGGFNEFVAVIASVSAIAAIMSTTDSAILGVSNLISRDVMQNLLFKRMDWTGERSNKALMVIGKITSGCIMLIAICFALYYEDLNDSTVYSRLLTWQNGLLWQSVPVCVLSPFWSHIKAWPAVIGIMVGMLMVGTLRQHEEDQDQWGTQHSREKGSWPPVQSPFAQKYYIDGVQWCGFANLFVTFFLSYLPFPTVAPRVLRVGTTNHDDEGRPLTFADINESVANMIEPIRSPAGRIGLICIFLLTNFCLPWYGDSYDGCNFLTMGYWRKDQENDFANGCMPGGLNGTDRCDGCKGPTMVGGLPQWATAILASYILMVFIAAATIMTWKSEEELGYCGKAWPTDQAPVSNENYTQREASASGGKPNPTTKVQPADR
jgi:Na+/proline symporter